MDESNLVHCVMNVDLGTLLSISYNALRRTCAKCTVDLELLSVFGELEYDFFSKPVMCMIKVVAIEDYLSVASISATPSQEDLPKYSYVVADLIVKLKENLLELGRTTTERAAQGFPSAES